MDNMTGALLGSISSVALFAFLSFAVWIDYRKKKDDGDAAHRERMKALELGHPPLDAEIARAKAYSSAAWAAGLIGLLVPLVVVSLTVVGTIVAVVNRGPYDNIAVPLIIAWSIAAVLVLVAVARSLSVIRRLPRPTADAPARTIAVEKPANAFSTGFREERSEAQR